MKDNNVIVMLYKRICIKQGVLVMLMLRSFNLFSAQKAAWPLLKRAISDAQSKGNFTASTVEAPPNKPFELLLEGGEARTDKSPVAVTRCSITFNNTENLKKCVEALRISDEALKARPEERKMWEWNMTVRDGMTIRFGVTWYDYEFFKARKNAFLDNKHAAQYSRFNALPKDIKAQHFVAEEITSAVKVK